jgi:hypothetical protein
MEEFKQSKRRGYIFSDKKFVCRKTSASLSHWLQIKRNRGQKEMTELENLKYLAKQKLKEELIDYYKETIKELEERIETLNYFYFSMSSSKSLDLKS